MATQTFSWASAGQLGTNVASAYFDLQGQRAQIKAAERVQRANNQRAAAQNSLAATIRSINNKRTMAAAGREYNAQVTNMQRVSEAYTRGDLEETVRAAEQAGQLASQIAASGVGGSSMAALSYASQLRQARAQVLREDQQGQATYDQMQQLAGIMPNASAGLQMGMIDANQDYSYQGTATPVYSALLQGLFGKQSRNALQTLLGSIGTTEPSSQVTPLGDYGAGMQTVDLTALSSSPAIPVSSTIRTQ